MLYLTKKDQEKTIRVTRFNPFNRKITVYFNNNYEQGISKLKVPYTKETIKGIRLLQLQQLQSFVEETNPKDGRLTPEQVINVKKYKYYLENRRNLFITREEAKRLGVKRMNVNVNTVDKYSYEKLVQQVEELKAAREKYEYLSTKLGKQNMEKTAKVKEKKRSGKRIKTANELNH